MSSRKPRREDVISGLYALIIISVGLALSAITVSQNVSEPKGDKYVSNRRKS